jgi:hypothetical protein
MGFADSLWMNSVRFNSRSHCIQLDALVSGLSIIYAASTGGNGEDNYLPDTALSGNSGTVKVCIILR